MIEDWDREPLYPRDPDWPAVPGPVDWMFVVAWFGIIAFSTFFWICAAYGLARLISDYFA